MRLTNNMISTNYMKNLTKNMKQLTDMNTKVSSQRRFLKMSEDPAIALSAFQVRKDLARNDMYKKTLDEGQGMLDEAEIAISNINDIATNARVMIMQGVTGTSGDAEQKVTAQELRKYQEMILGASNARFSDKYVFGGKEFENTPFTLDGTTGDLLYYGQNVDTGTFGAESRYVDIGIGMDVDAGGNVTPQSALDTAYSGITLLGSGVDGDGLSNNLYQLLGQIADKLEAGDLSNMDMYLNKLDVKADDIRMQYVGVGEKSNYITFLSDKLDRDKLAASTKSNKLEELTLEEGAIQFSQQELVYNACLQMGMKLLQPSLMDYLS